jgi:hypothetical protein
MLSKASGAQRSRGSAELTDTDGEQTNEKRSAWEGVFF